MPPCQREYLTDSAESTTSNTGILSYFVSTGISKRYSPQQLRKLVAPDETLLSFWITRDKLYVIALDNNGVSNHVIDRLEIDALIDVVVRRYSDYAATALYRAIVKPVEDRLKRRVVIAANGRLQQLPFAALITNDSKEYFGDQHLIRFTPTLSQVFTPKSITPNTKLMVMAPTNVPGFTRLDQAKTEAEAMQNYFGMDLALDTQVTREFFISEAPKQGVIHFSGHGLLNPEFPDYSKLILFNETQGRSAVFVEDIKGMNLSGLEMVVLSACESGITTANDLNNEFSSLGAAFLSAGAQSVVASLHTVEDTATRKLMLNYYQNLANGLAKDEALQKAQIYLRSQGYTNPNDWAAFTLWGSPERLKMVKQTAALSL